MNGDMAESAKKNRKRRKLKKDKIGQIWGKP
jgi:hypothetical protein